MEREQRIINIFKKYWYYTGSWHNAMCEFIRFDYGVCNCSTGKNYEKILSTLKKELSKPLKVEFYDKKGDKLKWK